MVFILLLFLTALGIEALGTWITTIGWGAFFANSPIIVALAIFLDVAKCITVSFLYKEWRDVGWLLKTYLVPAVLAMMVFTSAGAAGYLIAEFQKATLGLESVNLQVQALEAEQAKLQARKLEIDKQVAQLPTDRVRGRTQLLQAFKDELEPVNKRLIELDKQLPELQQKKITTGAEAGPITYLARAFTLTPDESVKWIIGLIIFIFDPLAVALLLSANYLLLKRHVHIVMDPEPEIYSQPIHDEQKVEPVQQVEEPEIYSQPIQEEHHELALAPQEEVEELADEELAEEEEEVLGHSELALLPAHPEDEVHFYDGTGLSTSYKHYT